MHTLLKIVLLASVIAPPLSAQQSPRDSALTLYDQGKHLEALPILSRLVEGGSTDPLVHARLGFLVMEMSGGLDNASARRVARARARAHLARAIELGSTNGQVRAIVEAMPEDGGDDPEFSPDPAVQAAMARGESAYGGRRIGEARAAYLEAFALDSTVYMAAVFIGDTYLHEGPVDSAYIWYRRATEIDPDQETAWRYWSDILIKHGQVDEARDKAINALVANPYTRTSRQMIVTWARTAGKQLVVPRLELPAADSATPSPARVAYDSVRQAWRGTPDTPGVPYIDAFPAATSYRHTLVEEAAAMRAAYHAATDDPRTQAIGALDADGYLESFILFFGADQGIAEDYLTYRAAHRELLRRFWDEMVIR
ncbi:MAG TPA: tetratricopeptide repeat protein [Gemmatimonadales bacterium]|nr:tetratricopeptide repeat protein [Gemmatimonadales bacterium]